MIRLLPLLLFGAPCFAADLSVGVGLGAGIDMGDRVNAGAATFGVGPTLQLPVRVGLAEHAAVRVTPRFGMHTGNDLLLWEQGGTSVGASDHWTMLVSGGGTVGPEFGLPAGPMQVFIGAEGGGAWVGTYHSLNGTSQALLDPAQNDVEDPNNIDPFTSQWAWMAEAHVGARSTGAVQFFGELGYQAAYVAESALKKSTPDLNGTRAAYGYNPLRIVVGVAFDL